MPTFGPLLRRTREQRGVSLDAIAQETRLSKRYLVALEEETIDKLPGGTYNRAYLRTYARFLGLEPEAMLRDYTETEARLAQTEAAELAAMNRALELRGELTGRRDWSGALTSPLVIAAVVLGSLTAAGTVWVAVSGIEQVSASGVEAVQTAVVPSEAPTPEPVIRRDSTESEPASSSSSAAPASAAPASSAPAAAGSANAPGAKAAGSRTPGSRTNEKREPSSDLSPEPSSDPISEPPARLTVADSGVGTGIVDRELVGQADQFSPGSTVVFWTHVRGGRSGDTIDHVWFRDGTLIGAASLEVGSADWRTQSRRVLRQGGVWTVEARDPEGNVLARHEIRTADQ